MKIALVQQTASSDRRDNVERGLAAVDAAAGDGADIVCFAELAFEPFYPQNRARPGFQELAESVLANRPGSQLVVAAQAVEDIEPPATSAAPKGSPLPRSGTHPRISPRTCT